VYDILKITACRVNRSLKKTFLKGCLYPEYVDSTVPFSLVYDRKGPYVIAAALKHYIKTAVHTKLQ
jgi:hypothetical protein